MVILRFFSSFFAIFYLRIEKDVDININIIALTENPVNDFSEIPVFY